MPILDDLIKKLLAALFHVNWSDPNVQFMWELIKPVFLPALGCLVVILLLLLIADLIEKLLEGS